ncbi:hypothetical protein [Ligilactobacillus salivarius]|nr:hypothetical protein [Ligilactobacillus salivarius]
MYVQLSELLNVKRKNSVLRSVFVTNQRIDGILVVEVEPYDKTGDNALNTTPSRYVDALKTISKAVKKYFDGKEKEVWINVYCDAYGANENIFKVDKGDFISQIYGQSKD